VVPTVFPQGHFFTSGTTDFHKTMALLQVTAPTFETSEAWTSATLQDREYQRLSQYIEKVCGIRIPPSKRVLLEGRLRRRLRALKIPDFATYCDHVLSRDAGLDEIVPMIDEITTNKTDFFREPFHFDFLAKHGLPALARIGAGPQHELRAWSAACSSGEEPYTLAMVLADFASSRFGYRYSILGTDICSEVLEQAKRAVYPDDRIEPIPFAMRDKYLLRSKNRSARLVRIAPHLRVHVSFRRLNFLDRDYQIAEPMDFIFCRNVLIYFSRETREAICSRLCSHLRPGGYFFIGHSETLQGMGGTLRMVAPTIYRKDSEP
jgi:chemotaxis protein methyltransferase CheR